MMRAALFLSLALVALAASALADDAGIIADVSQRNIAVTTGFNGAITTLFGALPEEGDVVVVVSGPESKVVVRRKEHVLGVWLNRTAVTFSHVPGFYWVASSRPVAEIVGPEWLAANRVGTGNLRFTIADYTKFDAIDEFREQLIQLRQQRLLYTVHPASVTIMGGKLYRADVHIPANAPTGNYTLTTYLFRRGVLLDAQQTPLALRKEGTMDELSDIAQNNSVFYGMLAVALALLTGWSSAVLMRRS